MVGGNYRQLYFKSIGNKIKLSNNRLFLIYILVYILMHRNRSSDSYALKLKITHRNGQLQNHRLTQTDRRFTVHSPTNAIMLHLACWMCRYGRSGLPLHGHVRIPTLFLGS